jgi:phage virion morphogenesis protein
MAAGFDLRVDVDRMLARLAVIRARWSGSSLQTIGDFAAAQILADSQQSFRRQADPTTGTPWKVSKRADDAFAAARLKHSTGRRRSAPKRTTTLVDTGRLRRSVRSGFDLGVTGKLTAWGGTQPLVYAAIHQFGGQAGRHHATTIPARPYIGLSPERVEKLRAFVLKTMAEDAR